MQWDRLFIYLWLGLWDPLVDIHTVLSYGLW